MARNRFDVDEELESPFNFDNLKKVMVYVVRYKWSMIFALLLVISVTLTRCGTVGASVSSANVSR